MIDPRGNSGHGREGSSLRGGAGNAGSCEQSATELGQAT